MKPTQNKKLETLIYAGLWLIVIVLMLLDIMRKRSYTETSLVDFETVGRLALALLPFLVLFLFNNYLLIPRLLKPGYYTRYFLSVLLAIAAIWFWQKFQFFNTFGVETLKVRHRPPHPGPHPLMPLPLFLDVIYDVLIVGFNLAISLMFQQFADRLKQERLMKENAENQLTYLKAQINPHFYMNMLNNIHGMIEIDTAKAQDMVIQMSSLMRYMLYESSRSEIDLSAEIGFIRDYVELMRVRCPEDCVDISTLLPQSQCVRGVKVPPLLFLVFLENAFKHGISYNDHSFVKVSLSPGEDKIHFSCMNSIHHKDHQLSHKGIGLENVKRRLDIIYGSAYSLEITSTDTRYTVNLTLPIHETENADN